jgi:RNA polymerase sigma factor for flagellar operon FliA
MAASAAPSTRDLASRSPEDEASQPDDEASQWRRWRERRDVAAREALISRHIAYARTVAATYYGRRIHDEIEFGDYLQYARIGLLESLDRFDPAQGVQFRTFAARRMHGAILDGIERLSEKQQQIAVRQRIRRERVQAVKEAAAAQAPAGSARREQGRGADDLFRYLADVGIGLAICRLLEGTGMVDTSASPDNAVAEQRYEAVELAQLHRRTLELMADLSPQQRTVIRYHYLQDHSFEEIADMMSVTRSRISQIHRQGLAALRTLLGTAPSCDVAW